MTGVRELKAEAGAKRRQRPQGEAINTKYLQKDFLLVELSTRLVFFAVNNRKNRQNNDLPSLDINY